MVQHLDREIFKGLKKVEYRLNNGKDDTGLLYPIYNHGRGFYLGLLFFLEFFGISAGSTWPIDAGACQKIIDGKIKMKSGTAVNRIIKTSIIFKDGSELPADIIIVATGFDDIHVPMQKIVSEDVATLIPTIFGLNEEGELRGPWHKSKDLPGLWPMMGNFAWACYFFKMMALQIKAKKEGLYGTCYAAPSF
ncbi:uncharacterized protein PHACADRAFT_23653 [Phanerochaete carnosa HHB-10118-sp]|uniref:Flavin-containing monooxygenase n=1 Tax=Phanerochaete carnosa (strain HHB-10118-sp) TaxID=650164 RepID=K5W8G2_PHACS|nr:uncharacterized protein PHACADRAFT_23653 [Phanerochaete carnosa HHB-10118-sp]EKM60238.1 hypothetical protein PHACADRAFT_23653 [Phanerochaete carnosa HHB-10118-sp]